jgi:hypothetical protein
LAGGPLPRRHFERHLTEARPPAGKTLATFDPAIYGHWP